MLRVVSAAFEHQMKDIQELALFAGSSLPDRKDDAAFRREMAFLDSETEVAVFAAELGVARTMVRGWQTGRYAPHPSLRPRYLRWLRQRAAQRVEQAKQQVPVPAYVTGKAARS